MNELQPRFLHFKKYPRNSPESSSEIFGSSCRSMTNSRSNIAEQDPAHRCGTPTLSCKQQLFADPCHHTCIPTPRSVPAIICSLQVAGRWTANHLKVSCLAGTVCGGRGELPRSRMSKIAGNGRQKQGDLDGGYIPR